MEIKKSFLHNPHKTKGLRKKLRSNPTPEESKLRERLRNRQIGKTKFRRQFGLGPYVVDFYAPSQNLIIEVDGKIHWQHEQKKHDEIRDDFLTQNEFRILRIPNEEINLNIEDVVIKISKMIL